MGGVWADVSSANPAKITVFSTGLLRAFLCSMNPRAGENSALLPDAFDLVNPCLVQFLTPFSPETTVTGNTV